MIDFLRITSSINDETRIKILKFIDLNTEVCVCDIENAFEMIQSRVSRHLKILKEANFLSLQRKGKWAHYSINPTMNKFQKDILNEIKHLDISFEKDITCGKKQ